MVTRHWPSLTNYTENLITHATKSHGLAQCDQFQDWLCGNAMSCCSGEPSGGSCPVAAEMGGYNYVLVLQAMSKMAGLLGKSTEAARYGSLHGAAAKDFHTIFYDTTTGTYVRHHPVQDSIDSVAAMACAPKVSGRPVLCAADLLEVRRRCFCRETIMARSSRSRCQRWKSTRLRPRCASMLWTHWRMTCITGRIITSRSAPLPRRSC